MTRAARFRLAVDDGGEWLAVVGRSAVLGHARGGEADVGMLADLDARHAELRLAESFHRGAEWSLAPLGARPVRVESGHVAVTLRGSDSVSLADGSRVTLAPKVSFTFRRSDPASASAVLELEHEAECDGMRRVLLLAPGPAGRVTLGASRTCLVEVAGLAREVALEALVAEEDAGPKAPSEGAADRLVVTSPGAGTAGEGARSVVPLPLAARVEVALARSDAAFPFVIALTPFMP